MPSDTYVSPVAFDLGALHTGVVTCLYPAGDFPVDPDTRGTLLRLPEDPGKLKWTQQDRRLKRHQVRGYKRRRLAKRLFRCWLEAQCGAPVQPAAWRPLAGLLNRRGYTRFEAEIDLDMLDGADVAFFAELFEELSGDLPVRDQFEQNLQDPDQLRRFVTGLGGKDVKKVRAAAKEWFDDAGLVTEAVEQFKVLSEGARRALQELEYGHRHRRDYFDEIAEDLPEIVREHAEVASLLERLDMDAARLAWIIGHFSNLQLRVLRKYFNDPSMRSGVSGAQWLPERLYRFVRRWVIGWRPETDEERRRRADLLSLLGAIEPERIVEDLFVANPPTLTIPPYEDQNNRRPPRDQTLWLDPHLLQRHFPDWRNWIAALRDTWPEIDDRIDEILDGPTTQARQQQGLDTSLYREALMLQRLLDRTARLDPLALRRLVREYTAGLDRRDEWSQEAHDGWALLCEKLGSESEAERFLQFASGYYEEVQLARTGLWDPSAARMFVRSDLHPPMKRSLLPQLVGAVLGYHFTDDQHFQRFLQDCWRARVDRGTVATIAKAVEEQRKQYGGLFNQLWQGALLRAWQGRDLGKEEKELVRLNERLEKATDQIATFCGHDTRQRQRYQNPYSLAQLYNLIDRDVHGFSRTMLSAHLENEWRMEMQDLGDDEQTARCSRLNADVTRPFDGVLARILKRQAQEIAQLVFGDWQRQGLLRQARERALTVRLPILFEENRFTSQVELARAKQKRKHQYEHLLNMAEEMTQRWQDKAARIREASRGVCPYTGQPLDGIRGEIDHILPQSVTRKIRASAFNHEANLIYCSQQGNQIKKNRRYKLEQLHRDYLMAQFGTTDLDTIRRRIHDVVERIPQRATWDVLTDEQRQALRHALFLDESAPAYLRAAAMLATARTSRVNGTQAWMAREIIRELQRRLEWDGAGSHIALLPLIHRVDAESVGDVRRQLDEAFPDWDKRASERQGAASHIADATCTLFAGMADERVVRMLDADPELAEDPAVVECFLPRDVEIVWIEKRPRFRKRNLSSEPLFKANPYAERFLPVVVREGALYCGFIRPDGERLVQIECADPSVLLLALWPYLDRRRLSADASPDELLTFPGATALAVARAAAIELLDQWRRRPDTLDDRQRLAAEVLESLRYITQRQEVRQRCFDNKGKPCTRDTILAEKSFTVKVKLSIGRGRTARASGKIELPLRDEWARLLDHPGMRVFLDPEAEQSLREEGYRKAIKHFFHDGKHIPRRKHRRTRRVYSLPVVPSVSGTLVRIRRRTPEGGSLRQLLTVEGSPAAGFTAAGNLNKNGMAVLPLFARSPDLTLLNEALVVSDQVIVFDEWRQIEDHNAGFRLWLAPGSQGRMYVQIEQSWVQFHAWFVEAGGEDAGLPAAIEQVPPELRLSDKAKALWHRVADHELVPQPRNHFSVLALRRGDSPAIRYWYIATTTSKAMRDAYLRAAPVL